MMTVRDYRQRAEECERLARRTNSEKQRQEFLRIAASWRELAAEYEANTARAERLETAAKASAAVGAKDEDQGQDE